MRNYAEQNIVVGSSVRKLIRSGTARFVEMEIFIIRAIPEWYLKKKYEVDYFCKDQRWNRTERSERSFASGIDAVGVKRMVPLDPLSLVAVASYRRSSTPQGIVLVKLVYTRFKSSEWARRFKKKQPRRKFRERYQVAVC